jgi:ribosome-binding protein aMBF1 (putative translation factor)
MKKVKKQYADIFAQAHLHPKAEQFYQESMARIRLAETLYRERVSQSLSKVELARRAFTSPAVISRIESAQVAPKFDVLFRIFKALGKEKLEIRLANWEKT